MLPRARTRTPGSRRSERAARVLSNLGYCSRSQADAFLRRHTVLHNGSRVLVGKEQIEDVGDVTVDGDPLDHPGGLLIALNKPCGYTCTHSSDEGATVYELVPQRWTRRKPPLTSVGRLDKDTSGLLLLTTHAGLVHELCRPRGHVAKVYLATLDSAVPLTEQRSMAETFASGQLRLKGDGEPCLPANLCFIEPRQARVGVVEGRYHQIRRMFAACGVHVAALHRERFGTIALEALASGDFRHVSDFEINANLRASKEAALSAR